MIKVPFLDLPAQYARIRSEVLAQLDAVCASGRFVLGPAVEEFETSFARYCEVDHCVGLNTGTSALHLALRCLDIGPGDEVITVPMTFVATVWAISYVGATPVFVDIDPKTRTLNPELLEAAITPRTRAIMPVHLYGQAADMEAILHIAGRHGLTVIEDAAQAHGARYRGRRVGGFGRISCFSFYPGKNLGAYGEGGALVTNDRDLAERARCLRNHAQRERYHHESIGYNYRMDAFQGAVLKIKLSQLDEGNAARRRHALDYQQRLGQLTSLVLPLTPSHQEPVFHLFVIEVEDRDQLAHRLHAAGIETGLHYPVPVHLQPAYRHLGIEEGSFPVSEQLARRCLSLPMFPELTENQIGHVCEQLRLGLTAHH
jgi:dTDP-4-amino-4,6-dideoxygalactose transaminase